MKQIPIAILLMTFLSGFAKAETKQVAINTQTSQVAWTGKKVLGQHTGTVNFSDGKLLLKDKILAGGNFSIDLNSIKDVDLTNEDYNKKLVGHLKSEDFFSVAKFPTATINITKVEKYKETPDKYKLTADVTIKGITNPVIFDAFLKSNGSKYNGTADIIIDRTKWDIRYGSSNFFEGLGDKAIKNEIELKINLDTN